MSSNWRHNAVGLEDEKQREAHYVVCRFFAGFREGFRYVSTAMHTIIGPGWNFARVFGKPHPLSIDRPELAAFKGAGKIHIDSIAQSKIDLVPPVVYG